MRPREVANALKTLPKTLDDTYDRILLEIAEEHRRDVVSALTWLIFSARPLLLEELADAIVIDNSASPPFDPEERLFDAKSVLNILSTLVTVTYYPEWNVERGQRVKEIRLAHFSVKEYLTSERAARGPASDFRVQQSLADEIIMESCLNYINSCDLNKSTENVEFASNVEINIERDWPLLKYACLKWSVHAARCIDRLSETAVQRVISFLDTKRDVRIWTSVFDVEKDEASRNASLWQLADLSLCSDIDSGDSLEKYSEDIAPPAYYLSCLGFHSILTRLLQSGADPNKIGGKYGNAILVASLKGHINVVETLLQHGSDVNMSGGEFGNALQAASYGGHGQLVCRLIKAGADVEVEGQIGSLLQAVVVSPKRNPLVVTTLLDHIGSVGGAEGLWLLRWGAVHGHDTVVRMLLDRGMPVQKFQPLVRGVSAESLYHGDERHSYIHQNSPMFDAVFYRNHAIAEMLADRWTDINEQDFEGRTCLYWAIFYGSWKTAELLLSRGADMHVPGPWGWTARFWATANANQNAMHLLNENCNPDYCQRCQAAEVSGVMEEFAERQS
jgi:ankyrin repeat protein